MAWKVINNARVVKDDKTGAVGIQANCHEVVVIDGGGSGVSSEVNSAMFRLYKGDSDLSVDVSHDSSTLNIHISGTVATKEDGKSTNDAFGGNLIALTGEPIEGSVIQIGPCEMIQLTVDMGEPITAILPFVNNELIGKPMTNAIAQLVTSNDGGRLITMLDINLAYDIEGLAGVDGWAEEVQYILDAVTHVAFPVSVYTVYESEE